MVLRKPLQPSEVLKEWIPFIQWETIGTKNKQGRMCAVVNCPLCNNERLIAEATLRLKEKSKTLQCATCTKRNVLQKHEVPSKWVEFIRWREERYLDENGGYCIGVICPVCKETRFVQESVLRGRIHKTLLCRRGCSQRSGPDSPSWRGGVAWHLGYKLVSVSNLDDDIRKMIGKMVDSKRYIREHRLIMAVKLGRSLRLGEVVHHKDGNKANNKIENLQLLTTKNHNNAHGDTYYQKWQEALSRVRELETMVVILGGICD